MTSKSSYLCDTLPAATLTPSLPQTSVEMDVVPDDQSTVRRQINHAQHPPGRKLCPRHLRMADEGTNLRLQQALDALPLQEREAVNTIWSNFSSSPHPRRALILQGLLTMCCFSQLSLLTEQLAHIIRIDPFSVFPREVSLKVLAYLDAISLGRAAQVSRQWRILADDDVLWRGICEQHIGQKCLKCGWGLPRLERKRKHIPLPSLTSECPDSPEFTSGKRYREDDEYSLPVRHLRRRKSELQSDPPHSPPSDVNDISPSLPSPPSSDAGPSRSSTPSNPLVPPLHHSLLPTRPWKDVYCERLIIERNWRRGRCTLRTLQGHKDGVMCLQINENLTHPSFPILITGSYDRSVRVWNLEKGTQIHCLEGHTNAVRALQFDEVKLVTASMDCSIKIWNWRTGACLRTLHGHSDGVVCVNFDSSVLASGSVDSTIKIWNFRNRECFTLRGHRNWVNAVQLWDSNAGPNSTPTNSTMSLSQSFDWNPNDCQASNNSAPNIDAGKMLFSASDDGTIKLWDLSLRTCIRQFTGHVGQVQALKLVYFDQPIADHPMDSTDDNSAVLETYIPPASSDRSDLSTLRDNPEPTQQQLVLVSGSLDNTVKQWDISSGKAVKTFFGHIEGVWAVASDKMRLISGSHDRTIKVWNCENEKCTATLVGHRAAITCLALGEDKIVSGSDDGDVRVWSFSG